MSVTFNYKLRQSQERETAFALRLQQIGYTTSTSQTKNDFAAYDVTAHNPLTNRTTNFEIKLDKQSATTGNVAVEVYKYTTDGKKTPSGITATAAQYMVYCFDNQHFYLLDTFKLWEMILNKEYKMVVHGGDEGRTVMCLFDANYFKSNALIL